MLQGVTGKRGHSLVPGYTAELSRLQTTNLEWITGNSKWCSVRYVFHSQTLIQTAKNWLFPLKFSTNYSS